MDNYQENKIKKMKSLVTNTSSIVVPGVPFIPATPDVKKNVTVYELRVDYWYKKQALWFIYKYGLTNASVLYQEYLKSAESIPPAGYHPTQPRNANTLGTLLTYIGIKYVPVTATVTIPGTKAIQGTNPIILTKPTVWETQNIEWNGSANSIKFLSENETGSFAFNAVLPMTGVAAGLSDNDYAVDYSDIKYGFLLQFNAGYIIHNGVVVPNKTFNFYNKDERLTVQRSLIGIEYFIEDRLIHTVYNTVDNNVFLAQLFASCSLYTATDSIKNANLSDFYYGRYINLDNNKIVFGSNNEIQPYDPSITNFVYIKDDNISINIGLKSVIVDGTDARFDGRLAQLASTITTDEDSSLNINFSLQSSILDGSSAIFNGRLSPMRSFISDYSDSSLSIYFRLVGNILGVSGDVFNGKLAPMTSSIADYSIDPGDFAFFEGYMAINGVLNSIDRETESLNTPIGYITGKIVEGNKAYLSGSIGRISAVIDELFIIENSTVCEGILPNAYSVTASMVRTPVIDANINLPSLTGKASFGASAGKTLPKMTGSAHMTVARMFSCSKTLKPLTGEASVTVGIVMSVEKTLPRLTGYAKVAKNINTSGTLPRITGKASIVSTAKNNIAGSGTLPRLTGKACFGGSVSVVFKRLVLNAASIETGTLITAKHTLKPLVGGGSIKKYGTAEASGTLPMLVATRYATASGRLPRLSGFAESKKAIAFNTSNYTGYCINLKNVVKYKEQQAFQLTQFDNFVFNSIQRVGNKYYGVNSNGLYEITGNTDNGSTINWQIVTHLSDFKIRNLKTIRYAYVRGRMTNDYEFNVYSEEEMSNEHSKIFSSSYKATNSRVVLGKGLTGSYYGFEMIGSGPVELDQIDIDYDILSRGLK